MRAAENWSVEWVEDEAVALDPSTGELHYLNQPAAVVFALILEHGYERGVQEAHKTFEGQAGFEEEEFERLVAEMVEKGLLVE